MHMEKRHVHSDVYLYVAVAWAETREVERSAGKLITSFQVSNDETLSKDRGNGDMKDSG